MIGNSHPRSLIMTMVRFFTWAALFLLPTLSFAAGTIVRFTNAADGGDTNKDSTSSVIASDGGYVVFISSATNLTSSPLPYSTPQVFRKNLATGYTELVSVNNLGVPANNGCSNIAVSADGYRIVFATTATNLDALDKNALSDVYMRDMYSNTTRRLSLDKDGGDPDGASGQCALSISAYGDRVVFDSLAKDLIDGDTNNKRDVFYVDTYASTPKSIMVSADPDGKVVTTGDSGLYGAKISGNGYYIAFSSKATNLQKDVTTNGKSQIYLRTLSSRATTELISKTDTGVQASQDCFRPDTDYYGEKIAFRTKANLVPADTNSYYDVYVRDRYAYEVGKRTFLVSVSTNGEVGNYYSGYDFSFAQGGYYIAFTSSASNLVAGDTNGVCDIFVRDLQNRTTSCVSMSTYGIFGDNTSGISSEDATRNSAISISYSGDYVIFPSLASNLLPNDTSYIQDLYLYDRDPSSYYLQPDLQVKVGSAFIGDNYYSIKPDIQQTYAKSMLKNGTTTFYIKLENDGTIPGQLVVTAKPEIYDERWSISYYNSLTDSSNPITTEITGNGWRSPVLEPGGSTTIRVVLVPGANVSGGQAVKINISAITDNREYYDYAQIIAKIVGGNTSIVSVAGDLTPGDRHSQSASTSHDGNVIAFASTATNLVPGDTNNASDIFVHEQSSGSTTRVSIGSDGSEANNWSDSPAISADGNTIAFRSAASNLIWGDTNGRVDVFVHKIGIGTTRVSISEDPRTHDLVEANYDSGPPAISADGRYIAFSSYATNLVAGDTNGYPDVFVYDIETGRIECISARISGGRLVFGNGSSDSPSISGDGSLVVFRSAASNLVAGDTNNYADIFVFNRLTGDLKRVSLHSDGTQSNGLSGYEGDPVISADGKVVAFRSVASNLIDAGLDTNQAWDVFVYELATGVTKRVSVSTWGEQLMYDSGRNGLSISANGRFVAFTSLNSSNQNVLVHDVVKGTTTRVNVTTDGFAVYSGNCGLTLRGVSISGDGRYVAFDSAATDLVVGDLNGVNDVFVHDRAADTPPAFLTDMLIKKDGDATPIGDNVYDPDGSSQSHSIATATDKPAVFHAYIQNDGVLTDRFTVTHNYSEVAGWTVKYIEAATGNDITEAVTGQGWVTPDIPSDGMIEIRVEVTPDYTVSKENNNLSVVIGLAAQSTLNSNTADMVRMFVSKSSLTDIRLVISPASPQTLGTKMTLTAIPVGGEEVEYRFVAYTSYMDGETKKWRTYVLREYTTQSTCTWTPPIAGWYSVVVYARNTGYLPETAYQVTTSKSFYVMPLPLTKVTLSANPTSKTVAGATVNLSALAEGGDAEYLFKVRNTNGGAWIELTSFSTSNVCTWTPTEAGTYTLVVYARAIGRTTAYDKYNARTFTVAPTVSNVSLVTSSTTGPAGMPIQLNVTPTGGGNLEYLFRVGYATDTEWVWVNLTKNEDGSPKYTPQSTCIWTPEEAREYTIMVYAREIGCTLEYQAYDWMTFTASPKIARVYLAARPATQTVGNLVTMTAAVDGGSHVLYKFRVGKRDDSGKWEWTEVQEYSSANTCVWTPTTAGTYSLVVWAKEDGSTKAYDQYTSVSYKVSVVPTP